MNEVIVNPIRGCSQRCQDIYINGWHKLSLDTGHIGGKMPVAYLDIGSYEGFIEKVRKRYKGNTIRDARKADSFSCDTFDFKEYIPDVVEINHSKETRCGRPMDDFYKKSIKDMEELPEKFMATKTPLCKVHYDLMWGVFDDKKLRGYVRLRRMGDYAQYAQILGHGDFLKHGIMYKLHFGIMRWLCGRDELSNNIKHVWYGSWNTFRGIVLWKKKAGFDPAILKEG